MKFNKERTSIRSSLETIKDYEDAFLSGALRKIIIYPSDSSASAGVWEKIRLDGFSYGQETSTRPMEVISMRIRPRCLLVDELTRHPNTDQIFIPITAGLLAVAGTSLQTDPANPDPSSLMAIPVAQGEAINIKAGAWHTLPFAILQDVICISVMHREDLDSYHDLRDLPAAGWVAFPTWKDPVCIH